MIGSSQFWECEREAPLLNRNANFFTPESADELLQRAQRLMLLLEERHGKDAIEQLEIKPNCDDEAAKRIFLLDAERTFKSQECRQKLVEVSQSLYIKNRLCRTLSSIELFISIPEALFKPSFPIPRAYQHLFLNKTYQTLIAKFC